MREKGARKKKNCHRIHICPSFCQSSRLSFIGNEKYDGTNQLAGTPIKIPLTHKKNTLLYTHVHMRMIPALPQAKVI